jgi:hypothetical protein
MAKDKKARPDSKPQPAAQATAQPAAHVAEQQGSVTGGSVDALAIDAAREHTDLEAPETTSGASGPTIGALGNSAPPSRDGELLTIGFPLPDNIPTHVLESASVVVKAKSPLGRWRTGRKFTPDETPIPFADLSQSEIDALTGDPELIVSLRVTKPA